MRAAIYCRVSTEDQGESGTSLESQLAACRRKAKEINLDLPEPLVFQEMCSGLTLNRPEFTTVRKMAADGQFTHLIVFSPDRLSRVGEEILTIVKELKINGVKLICVNMQFDDSLTGKFIGFVIGWASEFEAAQIKERTMRGKRVRATQGQIPQGVGIGIYGYRWDKEQKKRFIDEHEAKEVRKIFTLIASGKSRFEVACTLNQQGITTKSGKKWHPLTLNRMLDNEAYKGVTYWGKTKGNGKTNIKLPKDQWIEVPDGTPAIIGEELFERAQQALKDTKRILRGRPLNDYLLTGFIVCGTCGKSLIGSCLSHRYLYYKCRGTYSTTTGLAECKERYIRARELESKIWTQVQNALVNPSVFLQDLRTSYENPPDRGQELSLLNRKIADLTDQEKRMVSLYRMGTISDEAISLETKAIDNERQQAKIRIAEINKQSNRCLDLAEIEARAILYCADIRRKYGGNSLQNKRMVFRSLNVLVKANSTSTTLTMCLKIDDLNLVKTINFGEVIAKT